MKSAFRKPARKFALIIVVILRSLLSSYACYSFQFHSSNIIKKNHLSYSSTSTHKIFGVHKPSRIHRVVNCRISVGEQETDHTEFEYSRCLTTTTTQEKKQLNEEFALGDVRPRWKKFISRSLTSLSRGFKKMVSSGSNTKKKTGTLIMVRTGESEYTRNFTFTGWADPALIEIGVREMEHASRLLIEAGYEPDVIYTSRLKRAIQGAWIISQEMSAPFIPMYKSWRLNERHTGAATGLRKNEAANEVGTNVVQAWRRSLRGRPPPVQEGDKYHPRSDRKYSDLLDEQVPVSESLLDCIKRMTPIWEFKVSRDLAAGKNVIVVGHRATLRSLMKIIDDMNDEEIESVSIPRGIPLIYKFDGNMQLIQPKKSKLTLSSGIFLEKPDLFENALEKQIGWDQSVPGQLRYFPNKERAMTVEKALEGLRQEKMMYTSNNTDYHLEDTHQMGDADDENFEETHNIDTSRASTSQPTLNINKVEHSQDGIVVLVRHGRTPHNQLSLFTGWEDPPLAEEGVEDAKRAGRLLKNYGFEFDVVYTSFLYRAIQTAWFILDEMDSLWLPTIKCWRLNERHYGALTGKSKKMISNLYGEDQLKKWRRGYNIRPPPVSSYSFQYFGNDRRSRYVTDLRISLSESLFRSIEQRKLVVHRKFPKSESLKDCMDRSIPFYTEKIVPEAIQKGKRVLIASHENALRGILMYLCNIPEESMKDLHLPNGVPLVYNVRRRCISLLDDGSGKVYDFGSAAEYLFTPCELSDDNFIVR